MENMKTVFKQLRIINLYQLVQHWYKKKYDTINKLRSSITCTFYSIYITAMFKTNPLFRYLAFFSLVISSVINAS